jgi:hypothetical protein
VSSKRRYHPPNHFEQGDCDIKRQILAAISIGAALLLLGAIVSALYLGHPNTLITLTTTTTTPTTTSTITDYPTSTSYNTITSTRNITVTVTQTTTTIVLLIPTQSTNPLVSITSMQNVPPYPPAGPIYKTTVINAATKAVTNVTMVFENHTFSFPNITKQNPLLTGQSTHSNFTYIGGFPSQSEYIILVYGTFQDGQPYAFIETIKLT